MILTPSHKKNQYDHRTNPFISMIRCTPYPLYSLSVVLLIRCTPSQTSFTIIMDLKKEDLLNPEKATTIIQAVIGLLKAQRHQLLLKIIPINVLLAAQCLSQIRSKQKELRTATKEQALQLFEKTTNHEKMLRTILALFELKELDSISQVFAKIDNPEKTVYRRVIQDFISKNADNSELLFKFLNILFENHRRRTPPKTDVSQLPTHTLWLWALEILPDDLSVDIRTNSRCFTVFLSCKNNTLLPYIFC